MIDPRRLRVISAAIFAIATLDIIEGTGLVLEQAWAEFVTLILTASFLPWNSSRFSGAPAGFASD